MTKRSIIVILGCVYMVLILSGCIGLGIMAICDGNIICGIFTILCSLIPELAMLFVMVLNLVTIEEEMEEE